MQVLFICHANMCRSALAEGLARKFAGERSLSEAVAFRSCGLMGVPGHEALPEVLRVAESYGVDLTAHESMPFTMESADWADYLVTMTRAQKRETLARLPMVRPRTFTFAEFTEELTGRRTSWRDIADPAGGTEKDFRRCAVRIHDALVSVFDALDGTEAPQRGLLERLWRPRDTN